MCGTVLRSKVVKTRKNHECFGCCRIMPKGSYLRYSVGVDGGDIQACYVCKVCDEIFKDWHDDCFFRGDMMDDPEAWEEARKKVAEMGVANG